MNNIVTLSTMRGRSRAAKLANLTALFATRRRPMDDVFWLKENAEWLGILAATDVVLPEGALAPFETFHAEIGQRLRFFPQYYRFLLSLCLDLEDLGMPGDAGAAACRWVAEAGLAEAELSDLQRAEALRLLARRGQGAADPALSARLHRFIDRSATFAMPNKKAAYELTHIVFYLAEYGRRDPRISGAAVTSLEFAGLLAYLDQNCDLLAEVCAALRFAGQTPSPIWEDAVRAAHGGFTLVPDKRHGPGDSYHAYLVTGWAASLTGATPFDADVPDGPVAFESNANATGPLRAMSECLYDLGPARSGDWERMRARIVPQFGRAWSDVLSRAEASTTKFDAFFEGFARADIPPRAVAGGSG